MNIKNFLLVAIALSVIGAGVSVSMYYQMLRIEHTHDRLQQIENKESVDEYYYNEFRYFWIHFEKNEIEGSDRQDIVDKMRADGYSNADIDAIDFMGYCDVEKGDGWCKIECERLFREEQNKKK